ncbi:hypothetical protein NQ315_002863 [Exocentrus adspersus]|uniref:Uncharacterized protein n=1 Tax=Exocentrus adspersus TaxID=1586481 RepID=A0AAV8V8A2_9CUCU|nr:hypothetical protein NQ315_002863 [Exocentrus adspersus]
MTRTELGGSLFFGTFVHAPLKIAKVNVTNPVTYLLEDMPNHPIKGCFYESELQRSKHPDVLSPACQTQLR